MVSHDLRAPLRHVTSYGTLARGAGRPAARGGRALQEAQEFVATMDQSPPHGAQIDGLQGLVALAGRRCMQPVAIGRCCCSGAGRLAPARAEWSGGC